MAEHLLYVNGQALDPTDLSFGEDREMRRILRTELREDGMVPRCTQCGSHDFIEVFDLDAVPDQDRAIAAIVVLMRRTDPSYSVEDALALRDSDLVDDADDDEVPPTPALASSKPARARTKTPASSGSQS